MKTTVLYHANCWDGFCAAWLFSKAFPDARFIPVSYGNEPPGDLDGRDVFIVDFSYPRMVLEGLKSRVNSLVVLDHHKTAEEELRGLDYCTFDMEKSGGRLAWEYLYARELFPDDWRGVEGSVFNVPWLVDYTEDRDLWRWELLQSRVVNAGLRSYPLDFTVWDGLLEAGIKSMADEGRSILRRESQIVSDHVRNAVEVVIRGHRVLAVNSTVLFSDIAGKLAEGRPFGVCYFDRLKDGKRQYSLRSRDEEVDVSEIAKSYGGGGHRNAAGFETALDAFVWD